VVKRQVRELAHEGAAVFPTLGDGDEIVGRGQLDVDVELILEIGNGPKQLVVLGQDLQVEVDGALPPAEEHRGPSAGQVDPRWLTGHGVQRLHEAPDPGGVSYLAHAAVRSKLTSRRISALYREWAASPCCCTRSW